MDGLKFFQDSSGKWRSQRTTHHLPFRRSETGGSEIYVETLAKDNPKIIEICEMHQVDPELTIGGAFVSWDGSMQWDKDDENHEGTTIFALIPEPDNPRKGNLLRERGYAEIVPIAGEYYLDEEDGLVLITEYETMNTIERFWFPAPNIRMRTSTVQRFGGFNTATFCVEVKEDGESETSSKEKYTSWLDSYSITGW
jgi:hypothetical protein